MCVCVVYYLVICPDVSSEDGKVVKPKRRIIGHIVVQPLIIWAWVTMETHIWTLCVAMLSADTQTDTHTAQSNSCFGGCTKLTSGLLFDSFSHPSCQTDPPPTHTHTQHQHPAYILQNNRAITFVPGDNMNERSERPRARGPRRPAPTTQTATAETAGLPLIVNPACAPVHV